MWPLDALHDPAWRPLTHTLLHFLWQGAVVAAVWTVLFRLSRARATQFRYALGLVGMLVMLACPVATFVWLETIAAPNDAAIHETAVAAAPTMPHGVDSRSGVSPLSTNAQAELQPNAAGRRVYWGDPAAWISAAQPYLLAGWVVGLLFFSGRLLFGVVGARRLGRGKSALTGAIADRAAALAARLGFRSAPRVFSAKAASEAIVVGLLRPMVLLPVAWLAEMPPDVLEAVIAHELAHIRRFDVWFNLFQRFVETLLFYHPAVWWLSRRVRLAREMCCDEMAAAATGERVVYATALELAARKRLEPPRKSLLEVALGITRMTLLDRVRNVVGLSARHEQGRWWPAAVMTLLVLPTVWFASMATTSAEEEKPATKTKSADLAKEKSAAPTTTAVRSSATAVLRIRMEESPAAGTGQAGQERFEVYKATQAQLLKSRTVLRAATREKSIANLPWIRREKASGNLEKLLAECLQVESPDKSEIMKVTLNTGGEVDAVTLLNAVVKAYMTEVVSQDNERKHTRYDDLDRLCSDKEQEIRNKREQLKGLLGQIGGADSETRSLRQRLILDELALVHNELAKMTFETNRHSVDLAVQKAYLEDAKGDARAPLLREIKRLEVTIRVTEKQMTSLEKTITKLQEEVKRLGVESVDIQMIRETIKRLESSLNGFTAEREKVASEIRSPPRISLMEPAE